MSSGKRAAKGRTATPPVDAPRSIWDWLASDRVIIAGFALAVLLFYFKPLVNEGVSIQWDAVDVQYSPQKYLADSVRVGKLPFWTPYVFSGMPFLADPQLGAWYPLNFPFFVAGITPRAIEWQLALHAFLAALGGYLLARDLLGSRAAGVFTGIFFAFSGLFTEHSSHVGIFQAAALLPWLLWTGRRAMYGARWLPAVTVVAACIVLIGHFQTALYSFFALAILLAVEAARGTAAERWRRAAAALACAALGAATLPAVMVLPGMELTGQSIRASGDYRHDAGAALTPGSLLTLVSPDRYGAPEVENYNGPQDITQFYLYMGILLVPLAVLGATAVRARWQALALVVAGGWYALGPPAGLYSLVTWLPGFRSVRAPVHMWLVVALGLALLAGAGVGVIRARYRSPWLALALLAAVAVDLFYWNMDHNGLAYARASFDELYGNAQERFRKVSAPQTASPLHRLWAPFDSPGFGSLNGSLENRIEVTYGYNPLQLARYAKYLQAAAGNTRLLSGLAVTAILDTATGTFAPNPAALPRISVPETVTAVRNQTDAAGRLASLDPAREALAEGLPQSIAQNGGALVSILNYEGDFYRARYQASRPTLLRVAVPYFPGWRAEIDGRDQPIMPVDVALMGVMVPPGSHELVLGYRSTWFVTGALVSALSWVLALGWLYWAIRKFRRGLDEP